MKRLIASSTMLLSMIVISLLSQIALITVQADEGNPPTMQQSGMKVIGYLWQDTNCDGLRQADEGAMPDTTTGGYRMSMFYIGDDGIAFTNDDSEVDVAGAIDGNIHYGALNGGGGYSYYIAMRPSQRPVGFVPSRYQVGEDRSIDNDMTVWPDGAWATSTFVIPNATGFPGGPGAVTGIDIGLCPVANLNLPYKMALPLVLR